MNVQTKLLNEYEEQSKYVGYHSFETETKIVRIIKDSQFVDFASTEDEVIIILEATPFYAESGGQIADTGTLSTADAEVMISDVNSAPHGRSQEHTSELQSRGHFVCRLLLEIR